MNNFNKFIVMLLLETVVIILISGCSVMLQLFLHADNNKNCLGQGSLNILKTNIYYFIA